MHNDPKTLRVANSSRHERVWRSTTTASPGDVVSFLVYYHNGVVGSKAYNTKIKVRFPKKATKNPKITVRISADNARAVSDWVKIKLTKPATLKLIPNTTVWHPGYNRARRLPNTITGRGVNLGTILGCWPFAGYVVFQAKIITKPQPRPARLVFQLDKKVANLSQNQTQWVDANSATAGDILQYRIWFKNASKKTAHQVRIKDVLPSKTAYLTGSAKLFIGHREYLISSDLFKKSGVKIPNLPAGQDGYLVFATKVKSNVKNGEVLTNCATIFNPETSKTDCAKTKIKIAQLAVSQPTKKPILIKAHIPTGSPIIPAAVLAGLSAGVACWLWRRKQSL